MAQPSLIVVVCHYGSPSLTGRLHRQLLQSDPAWAERVLVLDNAAPEPYPEAWKRLPENLYWGGALAWAARELAGAGHTHLWFLNNDLWFATAPPHVERAWARLGRLEKALGPVGVYSPAALANPYHPQMVADPAMQWRRAAYVDGIAPLFSLRCLEELGGVDIEGNPYGYGVDIVTSLAAHRAGWPVVVDHQVAVRHVYHSTARRVEGFMAVAARAEREYLTKRLGNNYAEELERLKTDYQDFTAI